MTKEKEIFREAVEIYSDGRLSDGARYNRMQSYVRGQVKDGEISQGQGFRLVAAVMDAVDGPWDEY